MQNNWAVAYLIMTPFDCLCIVAGGRVLPVNHLQRVVKGALIIETVQNEDAGQYTCTASNRDGQLVNRSVFVTVVGTSSHTSLLLWSTFMMIVQGVLFADCSLSVIVDRVSVHCVHCVLWPLVVFTVSDY